MYYGFRCYNSQHQPIGWLYTYNSDTQLAFTDHTLNWCKRWKTERGAKRYFDQYNYRWQKSNDGYLKIEVMPEIPETGSPKKSSQQLWNEANRETLYQAQEAYSEKRPVLSFRPTPEILEWLEEERWTDDNGKPESDAALLNRKLQKLMKLERQGF